MSLSILCVTNAPTHAGIFIGRMKKLSTILNCEFVLGLDGARARSSSLGVFADVVVNTPEHDTELQECVLDYALDKCSGEYVLRLDDDEAVSPALEKWLYFHNYLRGQLYSFPRVYLYPDAQHILDNEGIYPDLQTRLGLKQLMGGFNSIHCGNPHGSGTTVPYAIEHHNLIVKSYQDRQKIADRYEGIREGAGRSNTYGRYLIPEDIYDKLSFKDYFDGDFS